MPAQGRVLLPTDEGSLQQPAVFRVIDPATLVIVVAAIESYHYDAGTALPYPGDPRDTVYLVGSGRVRAHRVSADGQVVTLLYLPAGDCLRSPAECESGELRSAAVVADEGRIYRLRPSRLHSGVDAELAIARSVNAQLLRQILELCDRVAEMALYHVAGRTRRTLEPRRRPRPLPQTASESG